MTALTPASLERAALVTEERMAAGSVLLNAVEVVYVTETPTGLAFDADTPLEVWAPLVVRLEVQRKRLEFCLADAIIFGEQAYGDIYAQWVQETGLNKRTLQNIARIGRTIEPARRRASLSFAHHEAVASLPAPDQESLLDAAERQGWTRYELRDAVRERKEHLRGRAYDAATGAAVDQGELCWVPELSDLTEDERTALERNAPGGRHREGYVRGWLRCLVYREARDAFLPGRWRD